MIKILIKHFPLFIILMNIKYVFNAFLPYYIGISITYLSYIAIAATCLLYYIKNHKVINTENKLLSYVYKVLIIYIIIGYIKNLFIPSGLFPFFKLQISCALLSFGSIFIFRYESAMIKKVLKTWWKYVPIIFVLTFWKIEVSSYISILYLCTLLLVLLPFQKRKNRLIIITLWIFLIYCGLRQRLDFVELSIAVLLYFVVKFGSKWNLSKYKILFHTIMLTPLFFLSAYFITGFNILDFKSYYTDEFISKTAGDITEDTRSFLYEEAVFSSVKHNYIAFGRTPFYGYDSLWATKKDKQEKSAQGILIGSTIQRVSEVFIVNIYTWCGILGCLQFLMLYYTIGFKTIKKSQNYLLKVFALYIGLFWLVSWIAHQMFNPSMDYICLYIIVAMCINPFYRNMDDQQFIKILKSNQP